jgi:Co/Zn/Cd efflux system component
MSDCCGDKNLDVNHDAQRKTLKIVLVLNAVMFFMVFYAGWYAKSSALLSESLDYLGDSLTYILSFIVINMSIKMKSRVAIFKGLLILSAGFVVAWQLIDKLIYPSVPLFEVMGIFSLMGLLVNGLCLYLLTKHKEEDINMNSVWECSRNDIAAGIAVFISAFGVWLTNSMWPDVLVAFVLMILFFRSAARVLYRSYIEYTTH